MLLSSSAEHIDPICRSILGGIRTESEVVLTSAALLALVSTDFPSSDPILYPEEQFLTLDSLLTAACERIAPLLPDIDETGLTVVENVGLYVQAFLGERAALSQLFQKSEEVLGRDIVKKSTSEMSERAMKQKHKGIVKTLLKEIPKNKKPSLTIVVGPFAGGKSELIESELVNNESLIIDLDVIRQLLMPEYDPTNQDHVARVREESWILSDLLLRSALESGRNVTVQTSLHRAKRWLNDKSLKYAKKHRIPVNIKMILRPYPDCIARNWHRERKAAPKDLFDSMNGMEVIIDLVKKFGKRMNVELYDFYPLLQRMNGISPKMFRAEYERLMKFAATRKNISIVNQGADLAVLTDA